MRFNLVLPFRRSHELFCFLCAFILSQSSSPSGTYMMNNFKYIRAHMIHFKHFREIQELISLFFDSSLCAAKRSYFRGSWINFWDFFSLTLQILDRPQWLTVKGRSHCYVKKVLVCCCFSYLSFWIRSSFPVYMAACEDIYAYIFLSKCFIYVKIQVKEKLESRGCLIRTGCEVHMVSTTEKGM